MKKYLLPIISTTLVGLGSISAYLPVQASMIDKAAFQDDFNDGLVNNALYTPIGGSTISESNGFMIVEASANQGVSISFDSVLPESNWMGFKFDTTDFSSEQGFNINVREKNLLGQEFVSLSINLQPILSSEPVVFQNGVKKDLKFTYTIYDENGNPIKMDMDVWKRALEVPANGTWDLGLDWENQGGKDTWIIDWVIPELPEELRKVILQSSGLLAREKGSKFVDITVTSGPDPIFAFDKVGADPIPRHTPEPTSLLSLLALGTLSAGSLLKRNKKQKSTEKETTKVG